MSSKRKAWTIILIVVGVLLLIGVLVVASLLVSNPSNRKTIGDFPPPNGYTRVPVKENSYGEYLRNLPLKKRGSKVYYNSGKKWGMNYIVAAVVDKECIRENEDCADVCYHLHSDYLFQQKRYSSIRYKNVNGQVLQYNGGNSLQAYKKFMDKVMNECSTVSVWHGMSKRAYNDIQHGDVIVVLGSNGYMGHAVTVVDVAVNEHNNKKAIMVVEGNYPGVNIHLMRSTQFWHNPWYIIEGDAKSLKLGPFVFNGIELRHF